MEQLKPFQQVIGIDPSLVRASTSHWRSVSQRTFVTAALSAYWFNWSKLRPQTHRVLRRGGTAVFCVLLSVSMPSGQLSRFKFLPRFGQDFESQIIPPDTSDTFHERFPEVRKIQGSG